MLCPEKLGSNKTRIISLKPRACEDIYLPYRIEAEGASSTLTSFSTPTDEKNKQNQT